MHDGRFPIKRLLAPLVAVGAVLIALRGVALVGLRDQAATGQVSVLRSRSFMPPSGMVAYQAVPMPPQPAPATEPAGPRKPHAPPAPDEVRSLAIKDLGNFDYPTESGSSSGVIPDDVRRLDGMTVRLRGYMVPANQAGADERLTRFSLVPSLFSCCYGQPPGVQHVVDVDCAGSHAVTFTPNLVVVEGKLKVGEVKDEGFVICLFRVIASDVREDAAAVSAAAPIPR